MTFKSLFLKWAFITNFIIMSDYRFYKYIDEKSILIVNRAGKLSKLTCPFTVKDKSNKKYLVQLISGDDTGCLYYKINGNYLAYFDFQIIS